MGSSNGDAKIERLLNLVLALLATRRPLPKETLRRQVRQYEQFSDELFDRMFERDKDELRELGIPLLTQPVDPFFDDEVGYRIDRRAYALPPIRFSAGEVEALRLAARIWSSSSLAPTAASAIRKLSAAGAESGESALLTGVADGVVDEVDQFMVSTSVPSFEVLRRAVMSRRAVKFEYRRSGGEVSSRQVQPWRLQAWHGRWYVTGFDVVRGAERLFRLDRIVSEVKPVGRAGAYEIPAGHDPMRMIRRSVDPGAGGRAELLVARRAGAALRLRAAEQVGGDAAEHVSVVDFSMPGFDSLVVDFDDLDRMAGELASYGPDVVVVAPQELRVRVVGLLKGVVAAGFEEGQR
ncbi:helix-turn-helix transcriptional regulator [Dermatophilus congolensis]|uniref:helix-turn-helix transcriptional regulator n=1 Tax=Dermatophilus congolensis TaxID=1863 RepID=UPI001AAEFA8F|nr:WYL domain-containing protein [Dermatophilus congolensis]MBO3142827.1 WYL domain-containing protein [Dermatophilus congolensis]MBO3151820.1 WYL domain-containing protein [Dermatophilus congolensis]MBO3161177.1 WYL domain-containing protein [Dermatophilus congolensis]MBO3163102.1 WYL domain-containing protein [Dermatophilus congolensis]MBO3176656.1 WYL domain-containing protein [Dermatophilus congolensis]